MKRSLALLLAAIMVISMVPATLLSASAHGIGVGVNGIDNLSYNNAEGIDVPATVYVDGVADDTAWGGKEWNIVTSHTGVWDVTTAKNTSFAYKYQLFTDHKYLYGVFVVDTNAVFSGALGEVTVYINDGDGAKCTDKIVLTTDGTNVTFDIYNNGVKLSADKGAGTIDAMLKGFKNDGGIYTYEFRTLTSNITETDRNLSAYVSVSVGGEKLYHPRFAVSDGNTSIDPEADWPDNAVEITEREINATSGASGWGSANADMSKVLPSEIHVDGQLNEGIWESFTDFYRSGKNVYEYRNETENGWNLLNLTTGYSDSMYRYIREDGLVNKYYEKTPKSLTDPFNTQRTSDIYYYDASGNVVSMTAAESRTKYGVGANATAQNIQLYDPTGVDPYYDAEYFEWDDSPVAFKYDLRADAEYFYGAIVANIDCSNMDFYYHLQAIKNPTDKQTLTVPTYFFVVFDANGASNTYMLQYNTKVQYNASKGIWELASDQTIQKAQNGWLGAKRISRYLINFEFAIPLKTATAKDGAIAVTGLLKDGKYYDADTDGYTADELEIHHTLAISNVSGMYATAVYDINGDGTQDASRETVAISYYNNNGGKNADGTYKAASGSAFGDQHFIIKVNAEYSSYTPVAGEVYNGNDHVAAAYHAWSIGGGLNSSVPVYARADKVEGDGVAQMPDGILFPEYYANLLAADPYVNGMGRGTGVAGKGEDLTHPAVGSFYHEFYADSEYLYGAAVLMDDDGAWKHRAGTSTNNYDALRLWINSGHGNWGEIADIIVNFYISDITSNSTTISMGVADVYEFAVVDGSNKTTKIATSQSTTESYGGLSATGSGTVSAQELAGYGMEVSMHTKTVNIGAFMTSESAFTAEVAVLEFKIPLETLGVSSLECDEAAFYYALSMENLSAGGGKGLCWPLLDNNNLESGSNGTITDNYADDRLYVNPWNALERDSAIIKLNEKKANTVTIDGNPDEEIWNNKDERENVNSVTGTWDVMPLGEEIFDYSYKVYTGRKYIYGMAEISAENPTFTLWVNANGGAKATNKFDFKIQNGNAVCYNNGNLVDFTADYVSTNVNYPKVFDAKNGGMAMHTVNGSTYLEFMLPMDEFDPSRDGYEYVVSVTVGNNTLYHPDNSNIENANETLYITHFNKLCSGSSSIITDDSITTGFAYASEAAFAPTEYEGVYKVVGYEASTEAAARKLDIPEGGFIYAFSGGNPRSQFINHDGSTTDIYGQKYTFTFSYSVLATNALNNLLTQKKGEIATGLYFRITGLDLENESFDYLYDDQWNSRPEFYNYAYGSNADYSIVTLNNTRVLTNGPETLWDTENDLKINSKERYYPETITIDGSVTSDYGWDMDSWIEVYNHVNGNTNNSEYFNCETEFGYKYQLRMDDEYVYVGAVLNTPVESENYEAIPAFRIWIQSKNAKYDGANSFTHLFDVRPGNTTLSVNADTINEYIEYYNQHYLPADGVDGQLGADSGVKPSVTINSDGTVASGSVAFDELIRAAENKYGYNNPQGGMGGTVIDMAYGETAFYGNTFIDAENLRTGEGNDYTSTAWYASVDIENYVYGNEHACFSEDEDGNMVVEFKFALADIGCENGEDFEYYVEARSQQASEADSYCLIYPSLSNESCVFDGDYARSYYFPYWVWGNTAALVDAEAKTQMKLRNPTEPVTSLGAQVNGNFEYNGSVGKALRFGILYRTDYLDDVYGKTDWDGAKNIYANATYWDVKDIGVIISPAKKLSLSGNGITLTTDTSSAQNIPSDMIVNHMPGSNMADYSSYLSYVIMTIPDKQVETDLAYRGYVEYYRYGNIYYDFGEATDELVTYRPTYYSNPLVRSYSLVEKVESGGFADPVIPIELTFNVVNNVDNSGVDSKKLLADASGYSYILTNTTTGATYRATTGSDGMAKFDITYTEADAGVSHDYTLVQLAGNNENIIYDSTIHDIEVDITLDNGVLGVTVFEDGFATPANSIVSYFNNVNNKTINGTKVVYVPLDNRPVNLDRAEFLAESAEIQIITPPENIISTTLENEGGKYTSDQGNPRDILNWLQTDPKVQSADYFVLSLDQLFSGGLVGSRAPFWDTDANTGDGDTIANTSVTTLGNYTLTEEENDIIDYIAGLCNTEGKKVYLFDTVMRLASTSGYAGWDLKVYNALRGSYAYKPRYEAHTLEDIIANYTKDASGNTISTAISGLTDEIINTYLLARERKLRIADALYRTCGNNADRIYIGVDDSVPDPSIQTNEINYITSITSDFNNGGNRILFAGADELGLVSLSAAIAELRETVKVRVQYFSEAGKDYAADGYDHESCKTNVEKHIKAVGGNIVTSGADMDILVLTRSASEVDSSNAIVHTANVTALVAKLKANQAANIPTCVIDASGYKGFGELARTIIADTSIDMGKIMGFSAWNTVGNAVGISLSNAIGRYSFLKDSLNITDASHMGFMKGLTYSFVKDEGYKNISEQYEQYLIDEWTAGNGVYMGVAYSTVDKLLATWHNDGVPDTGDFAEKKFQVNFGDFKNVFRAFWLCAEEIVDRINSGSIYVTPNTTANGWDVYAHGLYWPWFREFEANFTVDVYANGSAPATGEILSNVALGMDYTVDGTVWTSYPDNAGDKLTNGSAAGNSTAYWNAVDQYVGISGNGGIVFDFADAPVDLYKVRVHAGTYGGGTGVVCPDDVIVMVSDDGVTWKEVAHYEKGIDYNESVSTSTYGAWININVETGCAVDCNYVKVQVSRDGYGSLMLSELEIYCAESAE